MLTTPITAAPDVETFFHTAIEALNVSEMPQNDSECPAFGHDGPKEGTDTLEGFTDSAEAIAEAFLPDTADKVNWGLGKIAGRRAAAARIRENAELMARAEEREADALEWRFGAALQAFLRLELARKELEGGKKKSIRLYNGVIGFRTKPAGVHVTDLAAALAWTKEHLPEAVTEALDKRALSAALLGTGEAVPFADFQPAEDVFYIK